MCVKKKKERKKEMCVVKTEAPAPEKDTEDEVSLLGTSSEND